jgi:hypothetical protein
MSQLKNLIEDSLNVVIALEGIIKQAHCDKAKEALKQLQEESEWISVEKELPPSDKEVLCTNSKYKHQWVGVYAKFHGIVIEDDFDEVGDLDIDGDIMYLQEGWYELTEQNSGLYDEMYLTRIVTHWQPLPKPPKS